MRFKKEFITNYEDGITKDIEGLKITKILNIYNHIIFQLSKDNHKFQISTLGKNIRNREYEGIKEYLSERGIINVASYLSELEIPLSFYEMSDYYRIYFSDHSLFIAVLDDDTKNDLIINSNYELYNGALYESLVSEELVKEGSKLYFIRTKMQLLN